MLRTIAALLFAIFWCFGTASAEGFKVHDLTTLEVDASGFVGDGAFEAGANDPKRLTVFCTGCTDMIAIDVILGRSDDGTEERYRNGETTIEKMEALCKANSPTCKLDATELGNAVGWVTRYEVVGRAGSTTVLFLNGDQLIIRSIAADVDTAFANGAHALKIIGTKIIGAQ